MILYHLYIAFPPNYADGGNRTRAASTASKSTSTCKLEKSVGERKKTTVRGSKLKKPGKMGGNPPPPPEP